MPQVILHVPTRRQAPGMQAWRARTAASWEAARSVLKQLQAACGPASSLAATDFTLRDWEWASSTLLARSILLPVTGATEAGKGTTADTLLQCLVPGLDMANHSEARNCFWQVKGSLQDGSAVIELKAMQRLQPGTEATIAYSQEGNEALLFRYGVLELDNENDAVMLRYPLGQHDWDDEEMQTRAQMLQVRLVAKFSLCALLH
jgi:SET domain